MGLTMIPSTISKAKDLEKKIERLRYNLVELVKEKRSLTDHEVVKLSQELDEYIVKSQKRKRGNK